MRKRKLTYANFYYYLLLILPLAIIYVIFFIIPVVQSMFFSFTNFNGMTTNVDFVKFKNYLVAFNDLNFRETITTTVLLAAGVTIIQNVLAILLSVGMDQKFKGRGIVRTLIFAPCMMAPVVVAYLFQYIFSPDGLFQKVFRTDLLILSNTKTALWGIIIAHVWIWVGYSATIYMSNLQSISKSIKESAAIDGCNGINYLFRIILPMLAPSMTVNVTLAFTGSLKIFDLVYAMTNGGPNGSTETMGTFVMKMMNLNLHGYASTITIIMMVMIIISGQLLTKYFKKREEAIY